MILQHIVPPHRVLFLTLLGYSSPKMICTFDKSYELAGRAKKLCAACCTWTAHFFFAEIIQLLQAIGPNAKKKKNTNGP